MLVTGRYNVLESTCDSLEITLKWDDGRRDAINRVPLLIFTFLYSIIQLEFCFHFLRH